MKTKLISNFVIKSNLSTSKSQSQPNGKTKSWKHIPGPSSLPIIGQIHHFLPGSPLYECSGFEFQNHLFKNYGPIVKLNGILGRQPIIFIFVAESAARVLRGENWMPNRPGFQSLEYYRKHYSKHIRDPSKPTGLVNDVGENWKQLRFMVNPILLQTKTIKLYSSRINEIAEDMIKKVTQHLIQNANAIKNNENKNRSDVEKGIMEKLLDIDERIAVMMAGDTLFGGVDTIANTMTSTLQLLSKNLNKQHKLREKVKSGETFYIKACLKESMRMLPVAMGNIRITSKEYNLLGYDTKNLYLSDNLDKNNLTWLHIIKPHIFPMYVFFGHQLISMLESQYPRPNEYFPERWMTAKEDPLYYGNAYPFAYSPFGFGARSCIGHRIADLEVETFLTKVRLASKLNGLVLHLNLILVL